MREYAKIAPTFWTGKTGKAIKRHGMEAVVMATYLMSSPHSNMLGLFYQPMLYAAHETGLGIEGASKGLQGCIEAGFCSFDEASEMVWVHEMALYQIAEFLSVADKRCKGIQRDYDALPDCPFLGPFYDRYEAAFHLTSRRSGEAPDAVHRQAPSKPLRSQEQEQEQEQEQDAPDPLKGDAVRPRAESSELLPGFVEFWGAWPRSTRKGGKSECHKVWKRRHCEPFTAQIVAHVEFMKTGEDWRKEGGAYIPAPVVYLNQGRWDGAEVDASNDVEFNLWKNAV